MRSFQKSALAIFTFAAFIVGAFGISPAEAQGFSYSDSNNIQWTRKVLTENLEGGRKLMVVIEVPSDSRYLQRVIYRQVFKSSDHGMFAEGQDMYHSLAMPEEPLMVSPNPLWPIDHRRYRELAICRPHWSRLPHLKFLASCRTVS